MMGVEVSCCCLLATCHVTVHQFLQLKLEQHLIAITHLLDTHVRHKLIPKGAN
jgi:hypothetical protein